MAERMKRFIGAIPVQLQAEFKACVKKDGRSEAEIVRALIEQWIRETRYCQSKLQALR